MKRRVLFIALFLAVIGGLAWLVLHQREPKYQGRPLSYWLQAYGAYSRSVATNNHTYRGPSLLEASEALRQIGTNAFPELLRMLQESDSALKLKLLTLAQKRHFVMVHYVSTPSRNTAASLAFITLNALGFDLRPVAPDLIKIYERNISPSSTAQTLAVLENLGPAAEPVVPALMLGLTNTNESIRIKSLSSLCHIRQNNTNWVMAELTKATHDTSPAIRFYADLWLKSGRVGGASSPLSSSLQTQIVNSDEHRLGLLIRIGPAGGEELEPLGPVVATMLRDPLPVVRQGACFALLRLYVDNPPAPEPIIISALIETLKDPDPMVRSSAAKVLKQLDPAAAAKVGVK